MPEKILCNITVYGSGGVSTEEKHMIVSYDGEELDLYLGDTLIGIPKDEAKKMLIYLFESFIKKVEVKK
jgi:hypothetical protein